MCSRIRAMAEKLLKWIARHMQKELSHISKIEAKARAQLTYQWIEPSMPRELLEELGP